MANYPQLDNARGVWNMKEVYDAVMGGYWPNALSRGVFAGGNTPSASHTIDYVAIASTGDAQDFGDLASGESGIGAFGSFNRAIFTDEASNDMEYVNFNSTGNTAFFGDLTITLSAGGHMGAGNATRCLFGGGELSGGKSNVINYVVLSYSSCFCSRRRKSRQC